jgi:hypothetical protein
MNVLTTMCFPESSQFASWLAVAPNRYFSNSTTRCTLSQRGTDLCELEHVINSPHP